MLLAHAAEGSQEPSFEVREDRVAPGEDLGGASSIRALHVAVVGDASLLEREVAGKAIRADGGFVGIDGPAKERPKVRLERNPLENRQPRRAGRVAPLFSV